MSATSSPSSRRTRGRKRLRLRFAKRSSTRAGLLVLAFAGAALLAVVALAADSHPLTLAALALTVSLAGVVAAFLIVTERRRRQEAEVIFEAPSLWVEAGLFTQQATTENAIVIPLRAHEEEIGALRLTRER